jgi:hypothetical protein
VDTLLRELEISRRRGYKIVNGENIEDVVGVAAPIHDHHGNVSAALTVGGPRSRASAKLDGMAVAVMAAAASVSAALGYHGARPGSTTNGTRRSPASSKRTRSAARSTNGNGKSAKRSQARRPSPAGR